jgi:hypothetical protein
MCASRAYENNAPLRLSGARIRSVFGGSIGDRHLSRLKGRSGAKRANVRAALPLTSSILARTPAQGVRGLIATRAQVFIAGRGAKRLTKLAAALGQRLLAGGLTMAVAARGAGIGRGWARLCARGEVAMVRLVVRERRLSGQPDSGRKDKNTHGESSYLSWD